MTNYLLEAGGGPHLKAAMTVSRSYRAWCAPSCRAAARPYPHTNRTISRDGAARGRRRRLSQSDTSAFGPRSLQGPRDRGLLVVTARAAPRRLEQCDKLTVRIEIGWCSHQVARLDQSVLSGGGISGASVPVRAMAAYASRAPAMTRVGPTGQLSAAARRCHPP
jgi:hypothetical protein